MSASRLKDSVYESPDKSLRKEEKRKKIIPGCFDEVRIKDISILTGKEKGEGMTTQLTDLRKVI